jgi:hypothetical protein
MRENRFLTLAEIDSFLTRAPLDLREIVLELRNLVAAACPEATERILWGGLSYHDSRRGGPVKGAICQIELERDHVRLGFIHGVRLADPQALFQGDRLSKRYVAIRSYDEAPWEALRQLIEEAAKVDFSASPPPPGG